MDPHRTNFTHSLIYFHRVCTYAVGRTIENLVETWEDESRTGSVGYCWKRLLAIVRSTARPWLWRPDDSYTQKQRESDRRGPRTLMFAHRYGRDQSMWRHVLPAFESDFKVVAFDCVGSGSSDACAFDEPKYSTLRGYAQDELSMTTLA